MKRWILSAALCAALLGAGAAAADAHCGWGCGRYDASYADEACPCGYGDPHTRGDCPYYGGRTGGRGGWYDEDGYYHHRAYRHHGCRY